MTKRSSRFSFILALVITIAWAEDSGAVPGGSTVSSLAELDQVLADARGKPALVRVRADWNVTDAELDKQLLSTCVQEALSGIAWFEWDVTANNDADREFLAKYEVFGPPAFLLFDADGSHLKAQTVVGYLPAERLVDVLSGAAGLPQETDFAECRADEASDKAIDWDELIDKSYDYLYETQEFLEAEYNFSEHDRWDIDQETGSLIFSNEGVPIVEAKIAIVGSLIPSQRTWRWSWANSTIDPKLSAPIDVVRQFGAKHRLEKLIDRGWVAEEVDGWEMVAIANYLLRGRGVYRAPAGDLLIFVVITEIHDIE